LLKVVTKLKVKTTQGNNKFIDESFMNFSRLIRFPQIVFLPPVYCAVFWKGPYCAKYANQCCCSNTWPDRPNKEELSCGHKRSFSSLLRHHPRPPFQSETKTQMSCLEVCAEEPTVTAVQPLK